MIRPKIQIPPPPRSINMCYKAQLLQPSTTNSRAFDLAAALHAGTIAGAGLAAHLAGAIAAHTTKPVIGVPIDSGPLNGLDALLSTVQMPSGIPVATVAIGATGAKNAAYLAAQILALSDPELADRVTADRAASAEKVQSQNQALQAGL